MNDVLRVGLEDVAKAFGIDEDFFQKYAVNEVAKDEDLLALIKKRENSFDWVKETPLGGSGTTLNAIVLYCLIRHFKMNHVIETGVSGGYYSAFMLAALRKLDNHGALSSIEISDDLSEVGKLVPPAFREVKNDGVDWDLMVGKSSLDVFREFRNKGLKHHAQLYSHDSLHTMSHMLKELNEFKQSQSNLFFVFIDDEKSDNFWQRCLDTGAFKKPGYEVKWISGAESRLKGHLGGFIQYKKHV